MKLRVLLSIVALIIGLAVPFLPIWLKVLLIAAVWLVDAGTSEKDEKKNHSVGILFAFGLIVTYLIKFIWL
ncbi:hypothetical protein [Paenibacillus harenae]|uniref:hypothetical protein n=1 Tax=Paenibacillus harenae TaxID=306543 RepID=UPI00278DB791|nr:hypothetical protein [Paenibacillus harenae]MDQ0063093.1 hypothetical protein [Paenibacillus harenae]